MNRSGHRFVSRRVLMRRVLEAGVAALAGPVAPTHVHAQPRKPLLIGYLATSDQASSAWPRAAFEASLTELGWVIGRDIVIDYRYGDSDPVLIREQARALVTIGPDVLVTGGNLGTGPLRALTATIPIVTVSLADPVGAGWVRSLARPGGNVTGMAASIGTGVLGKRLQMLRAFAPSTRRVAALRVPGEYTATLWQDLSDAARSLDLTLMPIDLSDRDSTATFAVVASMRPDALCLVGQGGLLQRMRPICEFARREMLPATGSLKPFARTGLLFTYGIDLDDGIRRASGYVDRILKGAKPGDLPIEQQNRYELVINRRTAFALKLRIPPELLAQADEVIE